LFPSSPATRPTWLDARSALVFKRILTPGAVPYDPFKDLTPLGLVARTPIVLAVHKDAPFKNLAQMAEYGKKNPGNVRIGAVGPGSVAHFAVESVNSLTGADLTMTRFKGPGPPLQRHWAVTLKERPPLKVSSPNISRPEP